MVSLVHAVTGLSVLTPIAREMDPQTDTRVELLVSAESRLSIGLDERLGNKFVIWIH